MELEPKPERIPARYALETLELINRNEIGEAAATSLKLLQSLVNARLTLGIVYEGTLDESFPFYWLLMKLWPGRKVLFSSRDRLNYLRGALEVLDIQYDVLLATDRESELIEFVNSEGIDVFIYGKDICLDGIPGKTVVLKSRSQLNYEGHRWLFDRNTGKFVGRSGRAS